MSTTGFAPGTAWLLQISPAPPPIIQRPSRDQSEGSVPVVNAISGAEDPKADLIKDGSPTPPFRSEPNRTFLPSGDQSACQSLAPCETICVVMPRATSRTKISRLPVRGSAAE